MLIGRRIKAIAFQPPIIYILLREKDYQMQPHDALFTASEAAVLTGLPLKAVNNAIDKKTISAVPREEGGRLLDARALVSLSLERAWRIASRPSCGARCSMRWRSPRATSFPLRVGSSRLISASRAASWRRRCANCAAPAASSSAIPKSWVESGCGAVAVGRACLFPPVSFGGALVARP